MLQNDATAWSCDIESLPSRSTRFHVRQADDLLASCYQILNYHKFSTTNTQIVSAHTGKQVLEKSLFVEVSPSGLPRRVPIQLCEFKIDIFGEFGWTDRTALGFRIGEGFFTTSSDFLTVDIIDDTHGGVDSERNGACVKSVTTFLQSFGLIEAVPVLDDGITLCKGWPVDDIESNWTYNEVLIVLQYGTSVTFGGDSTVPVKFVMKDPRQWLLTRRNEFGCRYIPYHYCVVVGDKPLEYYEGQNDVAGSVSLLIEN
jgi:hypothetical protein